MTDYFDYSRTTMPKILEYHPRSIVPGILEKPPQRFCNHWHSVRDRATPDTTPDSDAFFPQAKALKNLSVQMGSTGVFILTTTYHNMDDFLSFAIVGFEHFPVGHRGTF